MTYYTHYLRLIRSTFFLIISFVLLSQPSLLPQGVLLQDYQDGDSRLDGDQTVNGVMVWKTGVVHVVRSNPLVVPAGKTLKIEPGAIVKFAGSFQTDSNGTVISWQKGGYIICGEDAVIQIEGATITDIRDDIGGDTNQDGANSVPDIPDFYQGIVIEFSGSEKSIVKNSTLKYISSIRDIGSTSFIDNDFLLINAFDNANKGNPGQPTISGNLFELSNNLAQLRLNGLSPIITDNTFRYSPQVKVVNGFIPAAVLVGPYISSDKSIVNPQNGAAIIGHNIFETGASICIGTTQERSVCSDFPDVSASYHVRIYSNKFIGTRLDGMQLPSSYGVKADISLDAAIFGNEFKNFYQPVQLISCASLQKSPLAVNYNQFEKIGTQNVFINGVSDNLFQNGVSVDFKNNFWGDPTGPNDLGPGADGITNPRGRGIYTNDNINYIPFLGGTLEFGSDELSLKVDQIDPLPNVPLVPGYNALFRVTLDKFKLASSDSGILVINIKDANGVILNLPETVIKVNAGNSSVTIPDMQLSIPDFNPFIYFEARLEPAGRGVINSNIVQFKVNIPSHNSLKIEKIEGLPGGNALVPGNIYNVNFKMKYSLTTSSAAAKGSIEIDVKEKWVRTGTVLNSFPQVKFDVNPGRDLSLEKSVTVSMMLKDILDAVDYSLLYVTLLLKDDAGKVVGRHEFNLSAIRPTEDVNIFSVQLQKEVNGVVQPAGRNHFISGDKLIFKIHYNVKVRTQNVTNWQIWASPARILTSAGKDNYVADQPANINVSTTPFGVQDSFLFSTDYVIPQDVSAVFPYIRLVDNTGKTIQFDSKIIIVEKAQHVVEKEVPAGNSSLTFTPIIITRTFNNTPSRGSATAEEFHRKFPPPGPGKIISKNNPAEINDGSYWDFISLNRYWSLYDNLSESVTGDITFTYDPLTDFPSDPGFNEDSLVLAGLNPYSNELEVLPTTLDKNNHTLTTQFSKFYEIWVAASKTTIVTDVEDESTLPTEYSLSQNYPNPFNPGTNFEFRIVEFGFVKLKIYDLLGKEVATLVNEEKSPGVYNISFNASNLASGIYFYRITAGSFSETKKMILLK